MGISRCIWWAFAVATTRVVVYCILKSHSIYDARSYNNNVDISDIKYLINYLGMSYDIIKGNPMGDPLFTVDLGYKRYILKEKLWSDENEKGRQKKDNQNRQEQSKYQNEMEESTEKYGTNIEKDNDIFFIAKKKDNIKCVYNKKGKIIKNLKDIDDEYKSYKLPALYKIHPFNSSNYYRMLVERIEKGYSIIIDKKICSRYFVALKNVDSSKLDPFFINMLNDLEKNYKNININKYKCSVHSYKKNKYDQSCLRTITPWITFFNLYGTHLVSEVYYGGKIINILYSEYYNNIYNSEQVQIYKKRLNPFTSGSKLGSFYFGSIISKKQNSTNQKDNDNMLTYIKEKNTIYDGGEDIKEYKDGEGKVLMINGMEDEWEKTINGKYAKPIKLILKPFSDFIKTNDGKVAYYKALEYYSNITYSEYNKYPFEINKTESDLYKISIKKWHQYIDKNMNLNISLKCENEEKIMSGFILTSKQKLYDDNIVMHVCSSTDECSSGINIASDKSFEFGWILCSKHNLNEVYQIYKKATHENEQISCPSNMKIGFGFILTIQKSLSANIVIEPCISGTSICQSQQKNKNENFQNFFWVNCLPNNKQLFINTLESKALSQKMHIDKNTLVNLKCTPGKFIISGFALDYISSSITDYALCEIGSSSCDINIRVQQPGTQEVHMPIIYIVCSSI
ncbi:perforin-like protein 5, putative [Plasmodium chabaudi chabaudi]|uniref:Perforin-like protein 5, putative n=1 Tax=Plasmodium chabaudi chabaudi TaxID=31271 RepID=A0A1C6XB29_PLACU|nr:perforin-like protein 5, putative [Plasmodium chabaudi chabaudi]